MHKVVDFVQMRLRKRRVEDESYKVANEATFGWKAEALYRKEEIFADDDLDGIEEWWQKPELSKEKKLEKLKQADRQAKFQQANSREFQQPNYGRNNFFNKSKSDFGGEQSSPYPNRSGQRCYLCQTVGHIARFCPSRDQQGHQGQYGQQRNRYPQLQQQQGARPQGPSQQNQNQN